MSTIRFLLKNKTSETNTHKEQTIFFRFRPSRTIDILLQTPYKIHPNDWDITNQCWDKNQITKGAKSEETRMLNWRIEKFNRKLGEFKNDIESFINSLRVTNRTEFKIKIKDYVSIKYFPIRVILNNLHFENKIPNKFYDLIEFYIKQRSVEDITQNVKPLSENTIKKYRTLQKNLYEFNKNLLATDIDDLWRTKFVNYLNRKNYSINTQVKTIKEIKMFCIYANKDNEISKQVLYWKVNSNPTNVSEYLTFTFTQLNQIRASIMPTESLDNVRDWLLISCYTSVRVSELLAMDKSKIIIDGEDYFIEVIEQKNKNKTGGLKFVYLSPPVIEILNKRNGNFPKKISDQKYNEYIKTVCKKSGLDHEIEWGKIEATANGNRKVISKGPFYKFITSHSGRATYVTLFKDKLPSEIIQMQTNHSSKEMMEHYDKTDIRSKMLHKSKLVAEAYKSLDEFKPVKLMIK